MWQEYEAVLDAVISSLLTRFNDSDCFLSKEFMAFEDGYFDEPEAYGVDKCFELLDFGRD